MDQRIRGVTQNFLHLETVRSHLMFVPRAIASRSEGKEFYRCGSFE